MSTQGARQGYPKRTMISGVRMNRDNGAAVRAARLVWHTCGPECADTGSGHKTEAIVAIEWTMNRYGSGSRASLSPILVIHVERDIGTRGGPEPKWRASVFGARLKGEFETEDDAKRSAERVARKHLAIAAETAS